MKIDVDALRAVAEETYSVSVLSAHGKPGMEALRRLLDGIASIYRYVEPALLQAPLYVVYMLDADTCILDEESAVIVEHYELIKDHVSGLVVVQLLHDGRLRLWNRLSGAQAATWANNGIVYHHSSGQESIRVKDKESTIRRVATGMASAFAVPTFTDLVEALKDYEQKMARHCRCKILAGAWEDHERLHFRSKPEATMRDSLTQFLMTTLRAEVRPEQNVDETQPVDIKITWTFTNRLALVEVKWLGDSRDAVGSANVTRYRDKRARDGAKQLADYLDDNLPYAPTHITRGYLVVFDGRRRGLRKSSGKPPTVAEAQHYRKVEIKFKPKYERKRDDFAAPVRLFLEPKIGS